MENFELYHHGIKGMHWGIRRTKEQLGYKTNTKKRVRSINDETNELVKRIKTQGKAASKIAKAEERAAARIAKAEAKYLPKKKSDAENKSKSISEMSDDEIRAKINRIRLENELKSLSPQQVSKGQKFVESLAKNVIAPAARESGKKLLTDFLNKKGAELLGLDANKTKDAAKLLQEEVSYLANLQKKDVLTKYFDDKQREADAKAKAETDAKNQAKQEAKDSAKRVKEAEKQAKQEAKQEAELKAAERRAKEAEKQAKEAEKRAKEAEKQAKQASKQAEKQSSKTESNYDYYVSGSGTSKRKSVNDVIIDADWKDVTVNEVSRSSLVTRGQNYVASLTNSYNPPMLPYKEDR